MTPPQSLLEMSGLPLHPSPLDRAVLVLIDLQGEYRDGLLPLDRIDAAAAEAGRLLALARQHGTPVFHVIHGEAPGSPIFDLQGPLYDFLAEVKPTADEPIVAKGLANAFIGTDLNTLIKSRGREEVIIAGAMTHLCVSATVRAAAEQFGYRVTVVADATATRDLPNPLGGVIPAETVRQTALGELADGFAVVVRDTTAWG